MTFSDTRSAVFWVHRADGCAYDTVSRHLRYADRTAILLAFTESERLGACVDPFAPLQGQSSVTLRYVSREPNVDVRFSLIYQDSHVVVVDKGPNYPVHPSGRYYLNTLIHALRRAGYIDIVPVHRLDKDTTGVVVCTRSAVATRRLSQDFASGRIVKDYLAIVHGVPSWTERVVNDAIGANSASSAPPRQTIGGTNAKSSVTRVRLLGTDGDVSLVECSPETGRRHQIRVHLAHIGYPIVGDSLYGAPTSIVVDRTMLHAARIRFRHPVLPLQCDIVAGVSTDMLRLLERTNLIVYLPQKFTYSSHSTTMEEIDGHT